MMRFLIVLFVLLLLNLVFEFGSDMYSRDWWLFDDNAYKLTEEWYLHEIGQHITFIVLSFGVAYEARFYRKEKLLFAWLQVCDFVDFLLTNNVKWIGFLSINFIILTVFALCVWRAYNREGYGEFQ